MQPLVPLVFHNLPSLYPPRNDFLYLFHPFLTVPNAPSKTMLEYMCKKEMLIPRYAARGDRTRTAPLRRYATNLYAMPPGVRAGEVGVAHYPKFSLETWDGSKNDRLGSMHTSDHRRSVWYKNERLHTFLRGARSFTG